MDDTKDKTTQGAMQAADYLDPAFAVGDDDPQFGSAWDDATNELHISGDSLDPDDSKIVEALGTKMRADFDEAKRLRREREEMWLDDLRQFMGIYDPEMLSRMPINRSRAFIRLTRSKVKSADARTTDMLFPAGDTNWTLSARNNPVMEPKHDYAKEYQILLQQHGGVVDDGLFEQVIKDEADKAAEAMTTEMEDQLGEINYSEIAREIIHSGNVYGTGVLKGPLTQIRPDKTWAHEPSGQWVIRDALVHRPYAQQIRVWDCYPDPYATRLEDCEYFFERHVMTKHQVRKLKGIKGFHGDKIDQYLRQHPTGDMLTLEFWEREMRFMSMDKDTLGTAKGRYEVVERWGFMDGQDLRAAGVDILDDQIDLEFETISWMIGNTVIAVKLNPTEQQSRPYKFYYCERDETSIWGIGYPRLMRDPQVLFNACVRMMVDNAAITSGPQIEINDDLLQDEENIETIVPFRIWVRGGQSEEARHPAVRVYEFTSHTSEFIEMARLFMEFSDEATALPRYTYNEPDGAVAKTVGGLSMLMGQANITLKDTAKNWDNGITTPFITDLYHWNMQFNPRENIKGDHEIVARGSSSLVARELRSHALDAFAQTTANPLDAPFIKRGELVRLRAQALELPVDTIVMTDEEAEQGQHAQMQKTIQEVQQKMAALQAENQKLQTEIHFSKQLEKVLRADKSGQYAAQVQSAEIKARSEVDKKVVEANAGIAEAQIKVATAVTTDNPPPDQNLSEIRSPFPDAPPGPVPTPPDGNQ